MRNNFIFFLIINTFKDTNVFLRCSFKHFFKLTCICNKWSILVGIQIERPKPIYDLSSEVQNTTYNFSNQINDIAKSCFNCINYTFKHPYNTSNPQLLGLSAFFACKARNNHLVAHVLVQQKRLRHKSPLPHKAA